NGFWAGSRQVHERFEDGAAMVECRLAVTSLSWTRPLRFEWQRSAPKCSPARGRSGRKDLPILNGRKSLPEARPGGIVMNVENATPPVRRWTAAELRKLPPAQRDTIMGAAAALAEDDYRNDPQLTASEAFGKGDLYGDSSHTETR